MICKWKYKIHKIVLTLIILPLSVYASNFSPIGGVYYDNINNLNANIGIAYNINEVRINKEIGGNEYSQFKHSNFLYSDISKGNNSESIGLGWGRVYYASNIRIGANYIQKKEDDYIGLEGTMTVLMYSLKLGVYNGNNDNIKFKIALGFGW